ncbi:hypothetical protein PSTT_03460 [Puccinia striiformis]|uniref:Transcription initiation factor TFIID subunit 12 domain-containing protein n=1 Tax=Puccinia striiformis TaxID=27350 RepID=A0A2S4VWD4_9BASI|nr:hypothetical protein PSTT_03460 [Puccinia striiformis]
MNPSFPIQRPGVVNSLSAPLITDPHLSNPPQPVPATQWATLSTNIELQRTLCKAAAAGQLNQDQMVFFTAFMKNHQSTLKMYQLEVQANQQQQIVQQQQQQQQKRQQLQLQQQQQQHSSPPPQHLEQDKLFPSAHQIANVHNGYISNTLPPSQAPLQMSHYQQSLGSSQQPIAQRSATADLHAASQADPQLNLAINQYKQAQDTAKNPNLSPAERDVANLRASELRSIITVRYHQHQNNEGNSPSLQNSQITAGNTTHPQHPNETQRAQISAVYQRQQQIISNMQYSAQANNANNARPLNNNLSAATASPRQNLSLSGRNSPAPNHNNNNQAMVQGISRPGSSHQSIVGGPASSPPPMSNAASPPNGSVIDLTKRRVVSRPPPKKVGQAIGTPGSNTGSPINQPINLAASPHPAHASLAHSSSLNTPHSTSQTNGLISNSNLGNNNTSQGSAAALQPDRSPAPYNESSLSPAPPMTTITAPVNNTKFSPPAQSDQSAANSKPMPPTTVPSLASQQHSAIAAQQQQQQQQQQPQQQQATAQAAASSTTVPNGASNQAAHSAPREPASLQPMTPAPVPFPPPRPTITGGHATSSSLAGSIMHRPPTNSMNEALGQTSGNHDSTNRGLRLPAQIGSYPNVKYKNSLKVLILLNLLLELADEFIDSVTRFSCQLAKHRKSDRLETKDIQLHLERSWNIRIPGFSNDEIRQSQSRRINALPSYQSRVAIVREAIRKRRPNNN